MTERSTEARHPHAVGLHARPPAEVLARLHAGQAAALGAIPAALPRIEAAAEAGARALAAGGRMAYAGAGSAGLMGLADCLELAGTFGIPPAQTPMLLAGGSAALLRLTGAVEDDPALAQADFAAAGIVAGDVVIAVSASGRTPYTVALISVWQFVGIPMILVYTAQGLPLAAFILTEVMKSVSADLKNAGRIDGLSEYRIFFVLVLPLVRPAMATVAVFTMIPIWNDPWFPLILAPVEVRGMGLRLSDEIAADM